LIIDQRLTEEMREKIKKFLKSNEKENRTYKNLWDIAKVVLVGKFIARSAQIKK
jgi:hypothetical protein